MKHITKHIDQIRKICDPNGITSLFAFGSVTTDEFTFDIDIDMIVYIDEKDH